MRSPASATDGARRRDAHVRGFSLIELLLVIAIIAIASSLTIPAFNQVTAGYDMSSAGASVIAQLSSARQTAITRNRNVEVRFYSYAEMGNPARFRAIQSFILNPGTAGNNPTYTPLGRMQKLPQRICFDGGATLSPLLGSLQNGTVSIPGAGTSYKYASITFRPDGSAITSASNDKQFLTLKEARLDDPSTSLPNDYVVIQIFPETGQAKSFRP